MIKQLIRNLYRWIFKEELKQLRQEILAIKDYKDKILSNIEVSVDVHEYNKYSNSWAVISIQGEKADYIKFINLGKSDVMEIKRFLEQFDKRNNIKIDASPNTTPFLKFKY